MPAQPGGRAEPRLTRTEGIPGASAAAEYASYLALDLPIAWRPALVAWSKRRRPPFQAVESASFEAGGRVGGRRRNRHMPNRISASVVTKTTTCIPKGCAS